MSMGSLVVTPPVEERTPFSYRDYGFTACSLNDPSQATTTMTPEAGKPVYTKIRVGANTDFSNVRIMPSQAATEQIANSFFGIYNAAGERLGVSADLSTAFRTTGEKGISVVADGGKSLFVEGGPAVYVWGAILIGTQGTTPFILRSGAVPNFGLAAKNIVLRTGSKGTGLTALPASFVPSELSSAGGPILIGA